MSGLPSDHEAVTTYRARVARIGGTRRPCLRLPDDVPVADGDLLRLTVEGTDYHARVVADREGRLLRGAYDNRRLAQEGGDRAAENRLVAWLDAVGRDPGASVAVDELDPGYHYGLREPGERVVYEAVDPPDASLAAIAERVDGDGE
ncbi:MAG: hypothetical protein ABEJ61_02320 [Haloferacaceae archaeon]